MTLSRLIKGLGCLAMFILALVALLVVWFLMTRAGWPRSETECDHLQAKDLESAVLQRLERSCQDLISPDKTVVFEGERAYTKGTGWLVPFSIVDRKTANTRSHFGMVSCDGRVELASKP